MMTLLQQQYLWPIALLLFPREGEMFHDHHSFMVQYKQVGIYPARCRWSSTAHAQLANSRLLQSRA